MFQLLLNYQNLWIHGFLITIALFASIIAIGIPTGIVAGIIAGRFSNDFGIVIKRARFIIKVIPALVLLFWLHYPLQGMLHIVINPFLTTAVAFGVINLISVADVVRNELVLLPKTYRESGITLGMNSWQIIQYIELPLLIRRALPQILLIQATMLEYTLFASLISVPELFRTAQTINAMAYKPVVIYSLLVVFFLIILGPLHLVIQRFQKKYTANYV